MIITFILILYITHHSQLAELALNKGVVIISIVCLDVAFHYLMAI